VLAVVEWSLDPHAVVAAISARDEEQRFLYGLLVPARLHGLDWAGEPNAGRPCAHRQLARLEELLDDAGVAVATAGVGDPETAPAIDDALLDWPAEEVLLLAPARRVRLAHPLALPRRVARSTGLPVSEIPFPSPGKRSVARLGMRRALHCVPAIRSTSG
jgi:hypothetical protein